MERPTADIDGCRAAHERLVRTIASIDDDVARRPSLLPDWSVGHLLTHLARNAEAMTRRVDGALRGEVVDQYVGGAAGRAAEIDAGAGRSARELVDDVRRCSERADAAFASVPDDLWSRPVRSVGGGEHPMVELPFRRWREVEVHLVDLGIGVTPADWSQELVDRMLPRLLDGLRDRADDRQLTGWLLGRAPAPPLEPWG